MQAIATANAERVVWFVVADEATALIYDATSRNGSLNKRYEIVNEVARQKTDELIADKGGRSFDSHGQGRHTLAKEKADPKRHASVGFAHEIAQLVSGAMHRGDCREFAIIAAPRFLGILRAEFDKTSAEPPFLTLDKDLVQEGPDAVLRHVKEEQERP